MTLHRTCERLHGIRALLLDIEGTTTSISFVKDILFGYVRAHIKSYVSAHYDSEELKSDIRALKLQASSDIAAGVQNIVSIPEEDSAGKEAVITAVVANVLQQMDADRKTTSLKQLQGHMWRAAYENREIHGQVYDDVPAALTRLTADGFKIYVYSSGSVEAQKLLFGNSSSGNLLQYFSGNFDTKIGLKTNKESYVKIADQLKLNPSYILFLTDIPAEAAAATSAGMVSYLVTRPGNAPLTDADKSTFRVISKFDELFE